MNTERVSVGDAGTILYVRLADARTDLPPSGTIVSAYLEVTAPVSSITPANLTLIPSEDALLHPEAEGWRQASIPEGLLSREGRWLFRANITTDVGHWRALAPFALIAL